ncbi:hypothetical protein Tco_0834503 [Tanacetum coccineum]
MQEFRVTATVHHHSIRFKMNNKEYIVNLEYFREMLQICPKLHDQQFEELPFKEEILTFLIDLGHSKDIKVDSALRDTQLYGAILPDELTNETIKDSESYKEYYVIASRAEPPKTKASVKKKKTASDKTKNPPTTKGKRLKTLVKVAKRAKKKQLAKTSKAKGLTVIYEKSSDEDDDDEVAMSGDDDDDADNQDDDGNDDDDQNDDNIDNENDDNDDDDDGQDHEGANVEGEELDQEETNEEDEANKLYRDVNINLEGRDTELTDALRTIIQTTQVIEATHVIITPVNPKGQQQSSSVSSGFVSNRLNPSPDTCINSIFNLNTESTSLVDVPVTTITEPPLLSATTLPPPPTPLISHLQQTPVPLPPTVPSSSLQNLPNFGSLFGLRDEAQADNEDFINKLDDNIKKIIKEQVKEKVKEQVSKILPKIEKTVNEQLEAEVLTRSSNESKTSHAIAANLSELKLKKILIDKMESNKSIHRSNEQKNLYKALVAAYESDKLILETYGDTVSFKRRRDDKDKDEEPSAGSNRGSKRRRAGKEPE